MLPVVLVANQFSCSGEHLMQDHPGDISGAEEKDVSAQIEAPIYYKVETAQQEEPSEHEESDGQTSHPERLADSAVHGLLASNAGHS
jgi:hypothetical protein